MQCFGLFELGPVIATGGGTTMYRACKQTDPDGEYVVKIFSPGQLLSPEPGGSVAELGILVEEFAAEFAERIAVQKQAADSSSCFVPVLGGGHEARGAWYATRYYSRSIQNLLLSETGLAAGEIFHIVERIVEAALHLKRTCGRSHGNLKPNNIFLEGGTSVLRAHVLLADPLAGDIEDLLRFERADVKAIGEILYQLVLGQRLDFAEVILPVVPGPDWSQVFGLHAERWLKLCNQLVADDLSTSELTLETLRSRLSQLKPKQDFPIVPVARTVGIILLSTLLVLAFTHRTRARSAQARLNGATKLTASGKQVQEPTSVMTQNSDLGTVAFEFAPPEASEMTVVQTGNLKLFATNAICDQVPGEIVSYRIAAVGYDPITTNICLASKESRHVTIKLSRQNVAVKVTSSPPDVAFFTINEEPLKREGDFYLLPWGNTGIVARHPRLGALTNWFNVSVDRPNSLPPFRFSFGTLILTNLPVESLVVEASNPIGTSSNKAVYEPLGRHVYLVKTKSTYETIVTNIMPGENYLQTASASQ